MILYSLEPSGDGAGAGAEKKFFGSATLVYQPGFGSGYVFTGLQNIRIRIRNADPEPGVGNGITFTRKNK